MRGLQQAAVLLRWAVSPTISCNNLATCPSELGGVAFPEAFRKTKPSKCVPLQFTPTNFLPSKHLQYCHFSIWRWHAAW